MTYDIEKMKKIATALSDLSQKERFALDSVINITVDGEEIAVGPFNININSDNFYGSVVYWIENRDAEYVIFIDNDIFDSWGTHYGDFGVCFYVGRVTEWKPSIEYVY